MRHEPVHQIDRPPVRVAASTLMAVAYLVKQNDRDRLHAFLSKHSSAEREAIAQWMTRESKRHG